MGILDGLKSAGKVLQEAGKIEQYQQILDAQEKMLEMQKRISELEERNKNLETTLYKKDSLTFKDNAYWAIKGEVKDGPFCTHCWDAEEKTIRMHPNGNPAFCLCPHCKKSVIVYPEKNRPVTAVQYFPDYR
jgi:hypothetical protein